MTINKTLNGTELVLAPIGRLDSNTAPELEQMVQTSLDGVSALVFDFAELEYISSAGLRVLLSAQKVMNRKGTLVIRHVNEAIAEILDITGFSDVLNIEA